MFKHRNLQRLILIPVLLVLVIAIAVSTDSERAAANPANANSGAVAASNLSPQSINNLSILNQAQPAVPHLDVTGTQKVIVLRVYFNDYTATSTYSKTQVEGFYDLLNQLWKNTSYNTIDIDYQVSDLFQLPDNRSAYIDDLSGGDLSNGGKFLKVLQDAIANAPSGLDWTDIDAVNVLMAETSSSQFHRGQATKCNLPMGPGGSLAYVGCAIFSENPGATQLETWGRFAHEMGHTFQQGGPAHPSNYNSEFELMDHNYPGQTGVFEKQSHTGFPGWMPVSKYQVFTPAGGGGTANIWAEEYPPAGKPNIQAAKVEITSSLYYLVSVRRAVLGDELHANDSWHTSGSPNGIPDEGVLIERVVEGADPWVTVVGPGGDRNDLWGEGQTYTNIGDGVQIAVAKMIDEDNYSVRIAYNQDAAFQPDVMLEPWTSPPGNTWETTDIWIDSPVNGYGNFSFGKWNDLYGDLVPRGNGDAPAIGQVNRIYARVRNVGGNTATDVVVHWDITDPAIAGVGPTAPWSNIGTVDKTQFPGLASIAPGDYEDVYVEWTPTYTVPPSTLADGTFQLHRCLRVRLDHVTGETVFANQDGEREQENIFTFQAVPEDGSTISRSTFILLQNDDPEQPKFFYVNYKDDLPPGWKVDVNGAEFGIQLDPDESVKIPVTIVPDGPAPLGSDFFVDVQASSVRLLTNSHEPEDKHVEFDTLGGVRVEARVQRPPKLQCKVEQTPNGIFITGMLSFQDFEKFYNPDDPFRVMLEGTTDDLSFLTQTASVVPVNRDGSFSGMLNPETKVRPDNVICLFAGTQEIAPAGTFYLPIDGIFDMYLPLLRR
jgi:hypothetical protein